MQTTTLPITLRSSERGGMVAARLQSCAQGMTWRSVTLLYEAIENKDILYPHRPSVTPQYEDSWLIYGQGRRQHDGHIQQPVSGTTHHRPAAPIMTTLAH